MPEKPTPRLVPASRWLVVTLGALSGFAPMAIDMYLPAFPQIARELGCSIGAVQLSLSVFLAGLACGQLLWGTLSDHAGRRTPLLVGCAAFAAASVLCACAASITVLILSRFLMGLGGSCGVVVARAVVRDLFDERESARFLSMMMIVGGLAPVVAPFLGGLILLHFSWRVVFAVVAGFGALSALAVARFVPETHPPERRAHSVGWALVGRYGRLLADARFLAFALPAALGSGVLFAYISGSPFVFIEHFGVSPQRYSHFFAANAVGLYATGQLNRWLLGRYAARQLLRVGYAVNVCATLMLFALAWSGWGGLWATAGALFLCLSSLALIFPNATAAAMGPFAAAAGTASALLGLLQYAIGATCGGLVGWLHNATLLPMAGVVAGASIAGGVALGLAGFRQDRAKNERL